jgi:hypothetical protein
MPFISLFQLAGAARAATPKFADPYQHNTHHQKLNMKNFLSSIALGVVLSSYSAFAHVSGDVKSEAAGDVADPPFLV